MFHRSEFNDIMLSFKKTDDLTFPIVIPPTENSYFQIPHGNNVLLFLFIFVPYCTRVDSNHTKYYFTKVILKYI